MTTVSVLVGEHTVSVSAFVVRHAEENAEEVMRWLLRRNTRLRGIAFALDPDDDVYLVGRLPTAAVTPAVLDDLFGALLEHRGRGVRHPARPRLRGVDPAGGRLAGRPRAWTRPTSPRSSAWSPTASRRTTGTDGA